MVQGTSAAEGPLRAQGRERGRERSVWEQAQGPDKSFRLVRHVCGRKQGTLFASCPGPCGQPCVRRRGGRRPEGRAAEGQVRPRGTSNSGDHLLNPVCHTYQVPVFIPTAILKDRYFVISIIQRREGRPRSQASRWQPALTFHYPRCPLSPGTASTVGRGLHGPCLG